MNKIFKNRIVIAITALILSIIFGLIFYASANSTSQTVSVVKVASNITKGTQITESMVKEENVGSYNLSDIVTDKSQVIGKYAAADLSAGDLILKSKVSSDSNANRLSNLNGTKSAISITIKTFADGLSDKLLNGDIVSCIITSDKETTTPKELNYVEVIAVTQKNGVDKQADKQADSKDSDNMATVTVLANQKQAELLAKYDTDSDIHLALVYRGEKAVVEKFLSEQDKILQEG